MLKFYVPDKNPARSSSRLRASIPAENYGKVISNIDDIEDGDVVVFSKKSSIPEIQYVVDRNIKFIFDICDDQFKDPVYVNLFKYACSNCHIITVPTQKMKELAEYHTNKKVFVTLELYERDRKPPKFSPIDVLKILFFGSVDNFSTVPWKDIVNRLESNNVKFKIDAIINYQSMYNINESFFQTHEWSFNKQTKLLDECDLVLLPFKNNSKNISTKSPNRIVESINRGKFVVTNYGVDSYNGFKDFIFLDEYDKLVDGILWSLNNKEEVIRKIIGGQKYIDHNYSVDSVSETWKHAYELVKSID